MDQSKDQASWQSIRDTVLDRIRSGAWPAGELIPTEEALAREFRCARMTVNRALRALAEDGMLDRRRRAGTRVAATPVRRATLSIAILRHEVQARGAVYRHAVLTRQTETPPAAIAARMGTGAARLLHLETLHMADGRPYAAEDRWINLAAIPELATADLSDISANEWLVRNAFYTHGEIAFSAEPATPALAERLDAHTGDPLFTVDRTTWQGETSVTAVRLFYPPGHRLSMTL